MDLFEQVSEDIKNAMKAKDKVALETLRNVKKFFLEAKTAPGANDTLTDADALKIMQKLVKQGKDSATIYVQQGRQDLADVELEQVKVIEKYLPQQMSAEELEKELKAIIAQVGAAGPKDMAGDGLFRCLNCKRYYFETYPMETHASHGFCFRLFSGNHAIYRMDVCKDIQSSYRKCRPLDCFRDPCLLRRTNDFRIFQRRRML